MNLDSFLHILTSSSQTRDHSNLYLKEKYYAYWTFLQIQDRQIRATQIKANHGLT